MAMTIVMITFTSLLLVAFVVPESLSLPQDQHRHTSRHIHTDAASEMRVQPPLPLLQKQSAQASSSSTVPKEKYLMNFLADMRSGTKVFQHFLTKSNLSQIVEGKYILKNVFFQFKKFIYFFLFSRRIIHDTNSI